MIVRRWGAVAGSLLALAGTAHADRCTVKIANGTSDMLVSVTVRAQFAPPGSEADRNLPVTLPGALGRNQSAAVTWDCTTSNISYVATGTFANGITRASTPFTPHPFLSGALDTAWIQ
jgi:hypothetical protein